MILFDEYFFNISSSPTSTKKPSLIAKAELLLKFRSTTYTSALWTIRSTFLAHEDKIRRSKK